jgi:hypothetical protein
MEEVYIKVIEGGIRSIRLGTKSPSEARLSQTFEKLKKLNEGMAAELMEKYKNVVKDYNNRKNV